PRKGHPPARRRTPPGALGAPRRGSRGPPPPDAPQGTRRAALFPRLTVPPVKAQPRGFPMKTDLTLSIVRQHHANLGQHLMDDDQADTSPLGVRRLPRRAIMARVVPHFTCSEQRQVKRWTRQAARHADPVRACKGHAGTSERGAFTLTSGESASFPLEP